MRRSPMRVSVERILEAHGLLDAFRTTADFHVRLEKTSYDPLVIERTGERVVVGHYYQQNGDTMSDPEVVFHYETWTPVEITQSPVGIYRSKFMTLDGETHVDTRFHQDVSPLVRVWARNLKYQGWENARQVKKAA